MCELLTFISVFLGLVLFVLLAHCLYYDHRLLLSVVAEVLQIDAGRQRPLPVRRGKTTHRR